MKDAKFVQELDDIAARMHERLQDVSALGRMATWIERNTRMNGRRFSFRDHEFQKEIVDDKAYDLVVIKPSQMGLTEILARLLLGFVRSTPGVKAMYGMQSLRIVELFAKSRVDPIIEDSPMLSGAIDAGSDSSKFKRFGHSQLHFVGLHGGKPIISIPTDILVIDELDFCHPESVVTAESRLSHSLYHDPDTGLRGLRRRFSTPTADGVGVDGEFQTSNRKRRLVRCKACTHWFWPDFLQHCVVDGYDQAFEHLTYTTVLSLRQRGLIKTARLLCPKCHEEVTRDNLRPRYRQWVAERPEVAKAGYAVSPFDLPEHHTPETLMTAMIRYKNEIGHFRNFVLGQAYSDASNSILEAAIDAGTQLKPVTPEQAEAEGVAGCVLGLDVGKTSWLTIGKVVDSKLCVLWLEQIEVRSSAQADELRGLIPQRVKQYGVIQGVVDALPYTPDMLAIAALMPRGALRLSMFSAPRNSIELYVVKDSRPEELAVHRSRALNETARMVNSGEVLFPICDQMKIAREHYKAVKRIDLDEEDGLTTQVWKSSGPDHYLFSLTYCQLAAKLAVHSFSFLMLPEIREAEIGGAHKWKSQRL